MSMLVVPGELTAWRTDRRVAFQLDIDVFKGTELHYPSFKCCYYCLKGLLGHFCITIGTIGTIDKLNRFFVNSYICISCWIKDILYNIGSATYMGLKIISNIGYRNIGKMSYQCTTKARQSRFLVSHHCPHLRTKTLLPQLLLMCSQGGLPSYLHVILKHSIFLAIFSRFRLVAYYL